MSEDCSVHVTVGRKLEIESHSEVFYPTISFVYSSTAALSTPPAEPADISAEPVAPSEPTPLSANVKAVNATTSLHKPRLGRFKLFRSRLGTFATAIVALLAVALVGAKIAGFRTFTVMSGSMEPDYPVG
ncbi:S26 family signal peptidase, partial [Candidatus Saccharibacteria bacterium]|nr:S26 family signal peptidase [Candidatus Saccharibacteria bacterium]